MVSIAESLNYRIFERKWRPLEKLPQAYPVHAAFSVSNKNPNFKRVLVCACQKILFFDVCDQVVIPSLPSKRRFMDNAIKFHVAHLFYSKQFLSKQGNWERMYNQRKILF